MLIDMIRNPGHVLRGRRHPFLFCFVVCTIMSSPFAALVLITGKGPLIVRLAVIVLILVVSCLGILALRISGWGELVEE